MTLQQMSSALSAWRAREIVDIAENPSYAILDLGCSRSTGSRKALEAFEWAAWYHGITCEWKQCWTRIAFANSKSEWLELCVVVHFPTNPPESTTIDVHEAGNIPILLSLPQMMNLGFDLHLEPSAIFFTCKILGYENERLPFSASQHALVDLAHLQRKMPDVKVKDTFLASASTRQNEEHSSLSVSINASSRVDEDTEDDDEEDEEDNECEALAGYRCRLKTKTTPIERPIEGDAVPSSKKGKSLKEGCCKA